MKVLIFGAPTTKGLHTIGIHSGIAGGGWVENLIESLRSINEIELYAGFFSSEITSVKSACVEGVTYISLPTDRPKLDRCTPKMVKALSELLEICKPDLVHIIGTEREYNLALLNLAGSNRVLLSTTGIISMITNHYFAGIDKKSFDLVTLGDFIRGGGPKKEKKLFKKFSITEKELFQKSKYVMGRTTWDYACVKQLNENIEYVYCGEIINPVFLNNKWSLNDCEEHRIFISQGSYPLKGLHKFLEAFPLILKKYPNTQVYIAGANILKNDSFMDRIKRTTYAAYISRTIKRLEIPKGNIHFTGGLVADQMAEQYKKAHVFVLPSSIENSPNSLGEAMAMGVPCVAAFVGGVPDMVEHDVDGFLYPFDESYMLAHYVCEIFRTEELAKRISEKARESARKRFDRKTIVEKTVSTYRYLCSKNHK